MLFVLRVFSGISSPEPWLSTRSLESLGDHGTPSSYASGCHLRPGTGPGRASGSTDNTKKKKNRRNEAKKNTAHHEQRCVYFAFGLLDSFENLWGPLGTLRALHRALKGLYNILPPWAATVLIYPILDMLDVSRSGIVPHTCPPARMLICFPSKSKIIVPT